MAGTTFAADVDDAGAAQDIEVAGGGGPAVGEAAGEVAGGELGAEVAEQQDELPSRGVRERVEDGIDFVEGRRVAGLLRRTANY